MGDSDLSEATPRPPIRNFRDLEVYQRGHRLMLDVHRVVMTFPRHEERGLTDQMRRASKSVGGLIAEGWGLRRSAKEFKNYLRRSLGSACEMEAHLETARDLGYFLVNEADALIEEYKIVERQLTMLIANWRSYDPSSVLRPPSSGRPVKTPEGH